MIANFVSSIQKKKSRYYSQTGQHQLSIFPQGPRQTISTLIETNISTSALRPWYSKLHVLLMWFFFSRIGRNLIIIIKVWRTWNILLVLFYLFKPPHPKSSLFFKWVSRYMKLCVYNNMLRSLRLPLFRYLCVYKLKLPPFWVNSENTMPDSSCLLSIRCLFVNNMNCSAAELSYQFKLPCSHKSKLQNKTIWNFRKFICVVLDVLVVSDGWVAKHFNFKTSHL